MCKTIFHHTNHSMPIRTDAYIYRTIRTIWLCVNLCISSFRTSYNLALACNNADADGKTALVHCRICSHSLEDGYAKSKFASQVYKLGKSFPFPSMPTAPAAESIIFNAIQDNLAFALRACRIWLHGILDHSAQIGIIIEVKHWAFTHSGIKAHPLSQVKPLDKQVSKAENGRERQLKGRCNFSPKHNPTRRPVKCGIVLLMSMMKKEERDGLESFSKRIETRIKSGIKGTDSMERLICRLLTGKDPKIAAHLATKWVEWRYGKAKENVEISGSLNLTSVIEKARKRAD